MINVSGAFKQALFNDNRKYVEQVTITLADNTVLSLTNANLWNGGFEIDDAVSNDNAFTALGSAIINTSTIVINNMYDDYSDYDFTNARVVMSVGLELYDTDTPRIEMCKKGTYIVDEATYNGSLITIKTMDYMSKFDEPYSKSSLLYPATADEIVRNACTICGVTLDTLNFPNKNFVIDVKPNEESVTFREVISYVATICGCYARCNPDGHLELKWYDQDYYEEVLIDGLDGGQFDSSTPYSTGDNANGGTFNPWNTGDAVDGGSFTDLDGAHYISSIYSPNIAVDDVVITGVAATYEVEVDGKKTTESYMSGSLGYLITIDKNPMITEDNVESIVDRLGTQLTGLKFRKATVSHSSDPTIEAGDLAVIVDRKGSAYPILVTRTHFKVGGAQTTVCGAETPARKSASRFSEATKSAVQLRKELEEQKTAYDRALEELAEEIANAEGMYETQVQTQGGGVITYMHNKPDLEESDIQMMISNVGVTVTANGTDPNPTWYGLTVDGNLIVSILNTVGINADWINAGHVSADYISGGLLRLGGNNNVNGTLKVYDASGTEVGVWDNTGLTQKKNSIYNYLGTAFTVSVGIISGSITITDKNGMSVNYNQNPKNTSSFSVMPSSNTLEIMKYGLTKVREVDGIGILSSSSAQNFVTISEKTTTKLEKQYWFFSQSSNFQNDYLTFEITGTGIVGFSDDGFTNTPDNYSTFSAAHMYVNSSDALVSLYARKSSTSPYYTAYLYMKATSGNTTISMIGASKIAMEGSASITAKGTSYINTEGSGYIDLKGGYITSDSTTGLRFARYGNTIVFSSYSSGVTSILFGTNNLTNNGNVALEWGSKSIAFNTTSARRYKNSITTQIDEQLDPHRLYKLQMKQYKYNDDFDHFQYEDMRGQMLSGFIAEDVAETYPSAVIHDTKGNIESWDERRILPAMLTLIQEQHEEIESLKQAIQYAMNR